MVHLCKSFQQEENDRNGVCKFHLLCEPIRAAIRGEPLILKGLGEIVCPHPDINIALAKDIILTDDVSYFSTDSRVLFELGEKLVTDRAIALSELVKNSYDADATEVTVRLENIKKKGGKISVEDNGIGMTIKEFESGWMRIATMNSEKNPKSKKFHRKKSGKKGIGRFACRKLANELNIESVAMDEEGKKQKLSAFINWNSFEPGTDVDKIPIKRTSKEIENETPIRTIITLNNVKDEWNGWDIRRLRIELQELISPTLKPITKPKKRKAIYDHGFSIEIECPEFPTKERRLDDTFYDNAWARLEGYVDDEGIAHYHLKSKQKIVSNVNKKYSRKEQFSTLRNIKLEIEIFVYNTSFFNNSEWSLSNAREIGRERGGIKVYSDEFRIFGYGREGDDWLGIDADRARSVSGVDDEITKVEESLDERPGLRTFMNRALFGYVQFDYNNNKMEIVASREKLTENDAFNELKKFTRLGIDFATLLYSNQVFRNEEIKREKIEEEIKKQIEEEEQVKKEAEEAQRKAEEEERKQEELRLKQEDEKNNIEMQRKTAEEERRHIENERRSTEDKIRNLENNVQDGTQDQLLSTELDVEKKRLKELFTAEDEARLREEALVIQEQEKRKKIEKERKKLEEEYTRYRDERRKAELKLREIEEKRIKQEKEKLERERFFLRTLASTGTIIIIYQHETDYALEEIEESINVFTSNVEYFPRDNREKIEHQISTLKDRVKIIDEFGKFIGIHLSKESTSEKQEWFLKEAMQAIEKPFKLYLDENGIEFDTKNISDEIRIPKMYKAELYSIIHNLLSNAIKVLKYQDTKRIEIRAFVENSELHIQCLDTGCGLEEEKWEEVFEPFISYSEPDLKYGTGTGLGLKIVRDIVTSYNGEIHFINPPEGWKTCIDIMFMKEK